MSRINPLVQQQIDTLNSQMGEDFQFHVWVVFGDGTCTIFNNRMRITVIFFLNKEQQVEAEVSSNVVGFWGCIQGARMTLPNKMLVKTIEQIETINHFLPGKGTENINDYYGHVVSDYTLEKRKERRKQKESKKCQSSMLS